MKREVKQVIAIDVGRGYTKYYSEYNGKIYKGMFKSIIGESRPLNFEDYDNPIYITIDGNSYFVGSLAELESHQSVRNTSDSKVSLTVKTLIYAVLSQIGMTDEVNIMLGVPNNMYRKSVLLNIMEAYKNKKLTIKDEINNSTKVIKINNIDIFKEADGIMMDITSGQPSEDKDIAFISVGFKTTEVSYYSKGQFIDRYSKTIPFGNQTILSTVQDKLYDIGVIHDLNYIDSNVGDYDDYKEQAYYLSSEVLTQKIEEIVPNGFEETEIYVGGGTALKMELDSRFKLVEDPQFSIVKGLFKVAEITF